jgi:hypothetical protein
MGAIAKKLGLEIQTSAQPINAESLKGVRILYLRAPSKEFTSAETEAIVAFVKGGGSLLLVLDEGRRQSLYPNCSFILSMPLACLLESMTCVYATPISSASRTTACVFG